MIIIDDSVKRHVANAMLYLDDNFRTIKSDNSPSMPSYTFYSRKYSDLYNPLFVKKIPSPISYKCEALPARLTRHNAYKSPVSQPINSVKVFSRVERTIGQSHQILPVRRCVSKAILARRNNRARFSTVQTSSYAISVGSSNCKAE